MLTNTQILINVSVWYDTSQLVLQVGTLRNELPAIDFHAVVESNCHCNRLLTLVDAEYLYSYPSTYLTSTIVKQQLVKLQHTAPTTLHQ